MRKLLLACLCLAAAACQLGERGTDDRRCSPLTLPIVQ